MGIFTTTNLWVFGLFLGILALVFAATTAWDIGKAPGFRAWLERLGTLVLDLLAPKPAPSEHERLKRRLELVEAELEDTKARRDRAVGRWATLRLEALRLFEATLRADETREEACRQTRSMVVELAQAQEQRAIFAQNLNVSNDRHDALARQLDAQIRMRSDLEYALPKLEAKLRDRIADEVIDLKNKALRFQAQRDSIKKAFIRQRQRGQANPSHDGCKAERNYWKSLFEDREARLREATIRLSKLREQAKLPHRCLGRILWTGPRPGGAPCAVCGSESFEGREGRVYESDFVRCQGCGAESSTSFYCAKQTDDHTNVCAPCADRVNGNANQKGTEP